MASLKCKYCGGNVSPFPENHLGTCSSCGAVMTLPQNTDKQHVSAHNCGNYLRRAGKFDKALAVYQKLLETDEADAESCWCSALCRFGVQYIEEDGAYRPVVLRPEAGRFLECGDYLAALSLSSGAVQLQYEKEARKIADCTGEPEPQAARPAEEAIKQGFRLLKQSDWESADGCFREVLATQPDKAMAYLGRLLAEQKCATPKELPGCGADLTKDAHYQKALQYADGDLKNFLLGCAKKIQRGKELGQVEAAYQQAVQKMEWASDNESLRLAARRFGQLDSYKDSKARMQQCLQQAEDLRRDGVYQAAKEAMQHGDAKQAAALYSQIPGWRDSNLQAVQCRKRAAAQKAAKKEPEHRVRRALIRIGAMIAALAMVSVSGYLYVTKYWIPQKHYEAAETLLEAGNEEEAIAAFQALGGFKDSQGRAESIQSDWYRQAEVLLDAGDAFRAAAIFGGLQDYSDARERSKALWANIIEPERISAGGWFTIALRSDRMVNAVGDNREKQCQVGSWMNIASVSAGWEHAVGLRTDGTAVAAGYNGDGRGNVENWRNMVAISAGQWHTVGLKSNGRVIGLGCDNDGRIDLDNWRDIIGISAGRNHTVGLQADCTAIAAGDNQFGQCDVSSWKNLQAVSAGGEHTLGLTRDGKVLAVGRKSENQCNVGAWENIVAVSAGYYHSVGLKADGTVVAEGFNDYGQCDVSDWTDIVAISAGGWHTIGLKADGSIVAVGRNTSDQCNVLGWDNMMLP